MGVSREAAVCPQGTWGRLLATRVSQGRLLEALNTVIFIHFIQIVPSQLFLGFPSRTFSVADPAQRTVSETKRVAACPAREDAGSRAAQTPRAALASALAPAWSVQPKAERRPRRRRLSPALSSVSLFFFKGPN